MTGRPKKIDTDDLDEIQVNARYTLVESAKQARNSGFSMDDWMTHPEVELFLRSHFLPEELLTHIGHWVWQPTKR